MQVSRDGWHWTTVYESKGVERTKGETIHIVLPELTPAKQILITANNLPLIDLAGITQFFFVLGEVEAIDEHGEDVALATRGSGVTVSSTNYGYQGTWDVYDRMWPVQYDLGAKWMRLSGSNPHYHHDTLLWRFVEQEKGKYVIDEKTDQVITEAANNGCNIVIILTYGNWLYTDTPEKETLDTRRWPVPFSPAPVTPQSVEGYKNWVRFMVDHFRGRVAYWEIYNEPTGFGFEVIKDKDERVKAYCDLVKAVVPVIRETDPQVKIGLAGMAGTPRFPNQFWLDYVPDWLDKVLAHGVAPLVDAIGWHIQGSLNTELPTYKQYPSLMRAFMKDAEAAGFKGIYMASEYWEGAPYPVHPQWAYPSHASHPGLEPITELEKAKNLARIMVMNAGLDVITYWCNTWLDFPQCDGGLFRNTFAADPQSPTQPQPGYYAMRTLATVLDGANPANLAVSCAAIQEVETYSFTLPDGDTLVSLALYGRAVDQHPGVATDVTINGMKCRSVTAIDTLNGFSQELRCEQRGGSTIIPQVLVRDYPLMLRLTKA